VAVVFDEAFYPFFAFHLEDDRFQRREGRFEFEDGDRVGRVSEFPRHCVRFSVSLKEQPFRFL